MRIDSIVGLGYISIGVADDSSIDENWNAFIHVHQCPCIYI